MDTDRHNNFFISSINIKRGRRSYRLKLLQATIDLSTAYSQTNTCRKYLYKDNGKLDSAKALEERRVRNYACDPLFLRRMYVDGGNLYVNDTISGVVARMATNDSVEF